MKSIIAILTLSVANASSSCFHRFFEYRNFKTYASGSYFLHAIKGYVVSYEFGKWTA